jgi:hypothetical protein
MAKKAEVLDEALALDVAEPVFIDELRKAWIDAKLEGGEGEMHARVQYAVGLSKSSLDSERIEALVMLQESLEHTEYTSEALLALAQTNYSLGRYNEARTWYAELPTTSALVILTTVLDDRCEDLLSMRPDHQQVKDLFDAIVYKHKQPTRGMCLSSVRVGLTKASRRGIDVVCWSCRVSGCRRA